jgi:hypothetical protein
VNVLAEGLGECSGAAVPDSPLDMLGPAAFGKRSAASFLRSEAGGDMFLGYSSDVARNLGVELTLDLLSVQQIAKRCFDVGPHAVCPLYVVFNAWPMAREMVVHCSVSTPS